MRNLNYFDSGLSPGRRRFYAGILKHGMIFENDTSAGEFFISGNHHPWSSIKVRCDNQGFVCLSCYAFKEATNHVIFHDEPYYIVKVDPLFSHDFSVSGNYTMHFDFMDALRAL